MTKRMRLGGTSQLRSAVSPIRAVRKGLQNLMLLVATTSARQALIPSNSGWISASDRATLARKSQAESPTGSGNSPGNKSWVSLRISTMAASH